MIRVKRVYETPGRDDGVRYLIERLWPRGFRKEDLRMDAWLKEAAPSDALRRWFGHDPRKWTAFQRRYFTELSHRREAWQPILEAARRGRVTLLYSASDTEHNNAVALQRFVGRKLKSK